MKKSLFLSWALLCSVAVVAQNQTISYNFDYNLNELYSRGPALTSACATGTISPETLPVSVTKNVYHFEKGCGLLFNDATKNFLTAKSYTIELYFKLDSVNAYKKLVDFDSLSKDKGLYNQNGKIVLYPNFTSTDSFFAAGAFQYIAITRDYVTKKMYINGNGKTAGSYTDNTDQYLYDGKKLLLFFQDDMSTKTEHTKGQVAMIRLSNYAMDSNTVKSNYTGLATALNIGKEVMNGDVRIYPNPVVDDVHISVKQPYDCTVWDVTGKMVHRQALHAGVNDMHLASYPSGVYVLRLTDGDGMEKARYKCLKY